MVYLTNLDSVLVMECQEGKYEAFNEIVTRYKDSIYNYVRRMISNPDDVDDLAQEVFVKAFGSIKSFRRESNLKTWLYRIATNLCVDRYRRLGVERKVLLPMERDEDGEDCEYPEPDGRSSDPSRVYEKKELQAAVHDAVQRLPDKLRTAVLLYDMEGMSYSEIAEIQRCPVGTVKSRLFKARMELKDLLKPYFMDGISSCDG